jgi:hypothetical protein
MSENQSSAPSTVEGKLGLDDLEKIAGGTGTIVSGVDPFNANVPIMAESDNVFTAYDGAKGTTLAQLDPKLKPMDFSPSFP